MLDLSNEGGKKKEKNGKTRTKVGRVPGNKSEHIYIYYIYAYKYMYIYVCVCINFFKNFKNLDLKDVELPNSKNRSHQLA